jgi:3-methyladenine DNA glycosylase/8-oxoguanine DNA glycosylase
VLAGGERVSARQLRDGMLAVRAETEAALDQLRFVLGVDDDHTPFLERFRDDELLAGPVRHLKGLRPARTATVTHALVRAICSQLITGREAYLIEGRLIRASTEAVGDLQAPPLPRHLARYAPAELYRFRLPARKATALVRICRSFDPERLRSLPPDAAAARLERERGIGPYSIGVVWTQGLGRYDRGIVGDLGLLKVCSAIEGRWVDADDTARLLARYEEWAGLACVYLMAGAARGLVPLKLSPAEVRRERVKARYAA